MLPRTITTATAVLGLWLIASQAVHSAPTAFQWTVAVTGALIGTLSVFARWLERDERPSARPAAGATSLLGVWLLIAPFLLRVDGIQRWNAVIVGILAVSLAGYNFYIVARVRDDGSPLESETSNP